MVALGLAVLYMDRLVDQSQNAVYRAVEATRDSRLLNAQITTMERYARQYLLLRDGTLLEAYGNARQDFQATARKLLALTRDTPQAEQVAALGRNEAALFRKVGEYSGGEADAATVADGFIDLADQGETLLDASSRLIDREVQIMHGTAAEAQRMLFGLAFALVPLTLLSVGVFTALIAHPIRQVDYAIRHLGDGNFDDPISVSGPKDLQFLGRRLDWLRERLRDLEQQKGKFLRHISHELKTPLTAIRESVELLGERLIGPLNPQQEELAQILRTNAHQLQALIEDLLNYGTSQHHDLPLYLSRVDLKAVVQHIAQNHKPALMAKRIELDCQLTEAGLLADREKLGTVVDNLLSNAIKFTPPGGRITLSLTIDRHEAVLTVADSGPGVSADERERIFDAFYQGRQRAAGYVKGSGLGLSIAREYVAAHQGQIAVVDHDGPGACLQVRLPMKPKRSKKT